MINLEGVTHHSAIEDIVEVLCRKTQNVDRGFFRVEVAYFLAKMASSMRVKILTRDRGEIPVNIYAICLATSGYGKGHSVYIIENDFMKGFERRFMEETVEIISQQTLVNFAMERALRKGTTDQEELDKLEREFKQAGEMVFTFDEASAPAVKQLRHKMLLAGCGSLNLQVDEIGSNLSRSMESLNLYLELYDQGMVKQKLTKNTNDNQRGSEIKGKTPANALLFGTPTKLFDGNQTEDLFRSLLETGYARRSLFGLGQPNSKAQNTLTPAQIYAQLADPKVDKAVEQWAHLFHELADPSLVGSQIVMEDDVGIKLQEYRSACEAAADKLPEHDEIKKAEISHRYFKALKLAGALAFVDRSIKLEMDHILQAILLVEEAGAMFQSILQREKPYERLAKYLADYGNEVTHADLLDALPFYPKGNAQRNEMMNLATAWGYKRHVVIKKTFVDGIEFFRGETLKQTDLDQIQVSYSDHWAYNYQVEEAPFDELHNMTQMQGIHWANHRFKNGHRSEENVIPGFNMIVLDVDGGTTLETAHGLLKDYKFLTYTTKRHSEDEHRFRLLMPINYYLELDTKDYREFMNGIMSWLPFQSDESANQRSKKWESFEGGSYHYNDGELFDALNFIPKTHKNELYQKEFQRISSFDNLERWFAQRIIANNNRNNTMIKYALTLVDNGMDFGAIRNQVLAFNAKLQEPLDQAELDRSVMVTVAQRLQKRVAA